jgi:hypothetical protein
VAWNRTLRDRTLQSPHTDLDDEQVSGMVNAVASTRGHLRALTGAPLGGAVELGIHIKVGSQYDC